VALRSSLGCQILWLIKCSSFLERLGLKSKWRVWHYLTKSMIRLTYSIKMSSPVTIMRLSASDKGGSLSVGSFYSAG
jgi:hypothetical protein